METKYYDSPRWTYEILDCSMPMTFDTYDRCSYNCLYCFSYFQKSISLGKGGVLIGRHYDYQKGTVNWVNVDRVKNLFMGGLAKKLTKKDYSFLNYIKAKMPMQWGGLSDPFDEYERKYGITLELLRFFKRLNYPLSFSTKGTWFLDDERYTRLIQGQKNWNFKVSIICLDENRAKKMEKGVDPPRQRLEAIKKIVKLNAGGATLRLRPFILGLSDIDNEYLELIKAASQAGASAVSTEFFCVEGRLHEGLRKRYDEINKIIGFDFLSYYKYYSETSGYYRLNRKIKASFMEKMRNETHKHGMRFYVSDAHFKEYCDNGCCCGLPESYNYSRGTFTEALMLAKKNGSVRFSEISDKIKYIFEDQKWKDIVKTNNCERGTKFKNFNIEAWFRYHWNNIKSPSSPYQYFGRILKPNGIDANGDIIYIYTGENKE